MNKAIQHSIKGRVFILFILFIACCSTYAQSLTTVRGVVKDAITLEKLPFVTVAFDKTTIGTFSDEVGEFKLSSRGTDIYLVATLLGYKSDTIKVPSGKTTTLEILLNPEDRQLQEVIVRPKKEKYSKKNNPAVELIKKVIAHKKENNMNSLDSYQYKEYERIFFALNEYRPDMPLLKRYKFLPNYTDTSIIDNKVILPFSIRERISDIYYRKDPKADKRIVKGYHIEGLDKTFDTEGLDAMIKEVFKDVSIYDNTMTLLLHPFVSPLSDHSAVNFYRWYLSDTVTIDTDRYVKLDFAPFNSRDVGFTGNLYISLDSTYAVKRAVLRTPKKMNINFVEELVIQHDYTKTKDNKWVPKEERMAIDVSMLDAVKFYVDKTKTYEDFIENEPLEAIFVLDDPIAFEKDYLKRDKAFWSQNRPEDHKKDYKMDQMLEDVNKVLLFKVLLKTGDILSTGYFPTSKDPDKNKLEIGTIPTFYSFNSTEGSRFRLTLNTTSNLNKNLYFYGYGAYGTRDQTFKYYGEVTWAFNKIERHKDEYPKNNLTLAYKYDINSLGQRFTQAERDNILMSIQSSGKTKTTYNRQTQVAWEKEYYGGFSFKLTGQTFDERPAANLVFEKRDENGNFYTIDKVKTTEAMLALRYAPNEKFFQQRRKRHAIPSPRLIMNLTHNIALKDVFGGQFHYNKTSFSVDKRFWVAPYGKLGVSAQVEKIWGETPFPFLITPSANNSYTIQRGNFYLIEPLEFVHDAQISWEAYYHMDGWFFNRIPFLKVLKWREVCGFRGFIGSLSKRNNPEYNRNLLVFPQETYTTNRGVPYMEYNVGIENILKLFRIDYVRRLNYLDHPGVNKDGFRVSFELSF